MRLRFRGPPEPVGAARAQAAGPMYLTNNSSRVILQTSVAVALQ